MSLSPHWRIEVLDAVVWIYTMDGLSATAAKLFLQHNYYNQPDQKTVFKGNIANNFIFRSIEATIIQSVIGAYEVIRSEVSTHGALGFDIPGLDQLKAHRTFHAHPQNQSWDKKYMKDFVANELHRKDNKAVRLYQVRQAIIDYLVTAKSTHPLPDNGAVATSSIVKMIKLCIQETMAEGVLLPTDIDTHIVEFFHHFNSQDSQDGQDGQKRYDIHQCR